MYPQEISEYSTKNIAMILLMKKKKNCRQIIFFDLDGTLVNHNFFLSPEIINAVKKIHNLGLRVSLQQFYLQT